MSQISKDSNLFYSYCEFQDLSTRMTIGSDRMVNGFYYVDDYFLLDKQAQDFSTSISSLYL